MQLVQFHDSDCALAVYLTYFPVESRYETRTSGYVAISTFDRSCHTGAHAHSSSFRAAQKRLLPTTTNGLDSLFSSSRGKCAVGREQSAKPFLTEYFKPNPLLYHNPLIKDLQNQPVLIHSDSRKPAMKNIALDQHSFPQTKSRATKGRQQQVKPRATRLQRAKDERARRSVCGSTRRLLHSLCAHLCSSS